MNGLFRMILFNLINILAISKQYNSAVVPNFIDIKPSVKSWNYTECSKNIATTQYILNRFRSRLYSLDTSTKLTMILFFAYESISPPFQKEVYFNVFNIKHYLVTFYWKDVLGRKLIACRFLQHSLPKWRPFKSY